MLFAIYCLDKPFSSALRSVTRDEHLAFVASAAEMVKLAGPLMSDDGEKMAGSFFVVEGESLEAVREWHRTDPYMKAGLFDFVDIRPWRWLFENGARREG